MVSEHFRSTRVFFSEKVDTVSTFITKFFTCATVVTELEFLENWIY